MQRCTEDGTEATVDNDATAQALEMLHDMRWEDNSMGTQHPLRLGHHQPGVRRRPGRHVHGRLRRLQRLVTENEIDPDTYGLTVLPLDGGDAGILGGGTVAAVSADATDAEQDAP